MVGDDVIAALWLNASLAQAYGKLTGSFNRGEFSGLEGLGKVEHLGLPVGYK